jgi:hypothetical protein
VKAETASGSDSGMLGGETASCCRMFRQGAPGLVGIAGAAAAVELSTRTPQKNPAVATAVTARLFVVRDMVLPKLL